MTARHPHPANGLPIFVADGVSATGLRRSNEDAIAVATPDAETLRTKGACFVLADGVSGSADGGLAARATVRGVVADYYATPDTWTVGKSMDRVIGAQNRWLLAQVGDSTHRMATTLSVLVIRGSRYYISHVGDSRIYRLSVGHWEQLTEDHVWNHPEYRHVLTRAVGLDAALTVDCREGMAIAGDVFVLLCDGVWGSLSDSVLAKLVREQPDPKCCAEALLAAAAAAGSQDNLSAVVVRIDAVPEEHWTEQLGMAQQLLVPNKLRPGNICDGFEVLEVLHESRASVIYRCRDLRTKSDVVLKTLSPLLAADPEAQAGLLAEQWLMKRLTSHYFPRVIDVPVHERQHLYLAMDWHAGATLADRVAAGQRQHPADMVSLGIRLCKAMGAMHRLNILHRDIKPENILIAADSKVYLLDFGVAQCPGVTAQDDGRCPGTPSYLAPECFAGQPASEQTDIYALGVTLYFGLTRKYPYGEIEPFQNPRFGDPVPASRYRPDLPEWLDSALLKAVARDPALRFETAEEMRFALEVGDAKPLQVARSSALLARDPLAFWQMVAVAALVFNLLLLFVLVSR